MLPKFAKLIEFKRNDLVEQEHQGIILHISKNTILNKVGEDNNYKFYQRSCMKPLQLALHVDLGLHDLYRFSSEEMAVGAASHCGDLDHQRVVRSILKKIDLDETFLLCPPQTPLSKSEQDRLLLENLNYKAVHNNCSGKHSMMLALCKYKGWSIENYLDDAHPLNFEIINKILELCEVASNDYVRSKDGCGLSTVATTLMQLGKGFLNLFTEEKYSCIKDAFLKNPYLIGGRERLDSEIIAASSDLLAKVGAAGLCVVVNLKKEEAIVVKIADANMKARSLVTIEALRQLGWLNDSQIDSNPINKLFDKSITTLQGEELGEAEFCFNL